jgi:co-chaperonin GroES (HSP10)
MNYSPTLDRVILKKEDQQNTAGIVIPKGMSVNRGDLSLGTIIAIGPGTVFNNAEGRIITAPMMLKVGMIVLFNEHQANSFEEDSEKYFIMPESQILAIQSS